MPNRYIVAETGTPKRPFEVHDSKGTASGLGWVVFASKSRASAEKRAAEMNAPKAWRVGDETFASFHEAEDAAFGIADVPFSPEPCDQAKEIRLAIETLGNVMGAMYCQDCGFKHADRCVDHPEILAVVLDQTGEMESAFS